MAHPPTVLHGRVDRPPIAAPGGLKPRGVVLSKIQRASDFYIAEQEVLAFTPTHRETRVGDPAAPRLGALPGLLVSQRLQRHFQVAGTREHDSSLNPVVSQVRCISEPHGVQPRRGGGIKKGTHKSIAMGLRSNVWGGRPPPTGLLAVLGLGPVPAALPSV